MSPLPIKLSIGTLRKPKLIDIAEIGFDKFNMFEVFLKMTPRKFYEDIIESPDVWDRLSEKQKEDTTIYQLILKDTRLKEIYLDLLNFFIVEDVIFEDDFFIVLKEGHSSGETPTADIIAGAIQEKSFEQVLELIQQICCIFEKSKKEEEKPKFKNNLARKLYEKIQKGNQEKEEKKNDLNLSIPNIISSVSCNHPSLNYTNIWGYTIFQLMDNFSRLQVNKIYDIDSARVSTWGDEKKTFDAALWYKNIYDT